MTEQIDPLVLERAHSFALEIKQEIKNKARAVGRS
jgi:hypothetical protein